MNNAPGSPDHSHDVDRGHSREYVTLRDYFERLLADQRAYFDRGAVAHDREHERERDTTLRALQHAAVEVQHRLEGLNELREEYTKDRTRDRDDFVKGDVFLARVTAIEKDMKSQGDDIGAIRRELSAASGRQATWMIVLTIALVLVTVLTRYL